ncbi:hypothetical protein [Longimicrobium sp.]|uniref:hypothetical protein n=1 Tax=Longimicrobium sp. TaxID=2029185 RepID=UPI003B3ACC30
MRIGLIMGALVALFAASESLAAQENLAYEPSADSVVAEARLMPLPAVLVPPAAGRGEYAAFDHESQMVPLLFGIFGGIAGLFVGDWWSDRECGTDCGAGRVAVWFLAGGLGAITGWVVGGGEIPQPPPERWP